MFTARIGSLFAIIIHGMPFLPIMERVRIETYLSCSVPSWDANCVFLIAFLGHLGMKWTKFMSYRDLQVN